MCVLIAEIIMAIGGIYALITGKLKLTNSVRLEGTSARIVGLILLLPIVVALGLGVVIGFFIGLGLLPDSALIVASVSEFVLVFGVLGGLLIYAFTHKPKASDDDITSDAV
jgi:membrane associated rhomboid family serine protease